MLDFHSAIRIEADGSLAVTERIEVLAEGRELRRGIFRDFPTEYRDGRGLRTRVPFEVLAVTRNGRPERYALERMANGARIRIGRAEALLERGVHVYEVSYRTARQLGYFAQHDELYWNVNGTGWTLPFDSISAEVSLPQPVPAARIRLEAYTGAQGDRGRAYEAFARDGGAAFRTKGALPARQGLTIVVGFPKGIVARPSWPQRAAWWASDNRGALVALAGVPLLFGFLYWRWRRVGRDPHAGPRYPRYAAPPGLGPAGVRYVDRMGYDERCFAAALLGLGARGYLKIGAHGEGYDIERIGAALEWLPGEKALATWLLPGDTRRVSIGKTYDPSVAVARSSFRKELGEQLSGKLFSRNAGSLAAGAALTIVFAAAALMLEAPFGLLAVAAGAMALMLALFARWLPAYSAEGRRLQDQIEGLRQYLGVAEADELRRMKTPPATPQEFAKFLPYAVALGVEKTWADRFAAALGSAALSAAVADYYSGPSGYDRDFGGSFASSMSELGGAVAAASTAPGSSPGTSDSGGGGGGSSGGGGGGGGGGGW